MPNAYDNQRSANAFDQFLNSEDGEIQREILWNNIAPLLPPPGEIAILDAACGQGWLAGKLSDKYQSLEAFDSSEALIEQAQRNFPQVKFKVADLTKSLPYLPESFDVVILNMAAHDLSNLSRAFENLHTVLKPGGNLIMTIANPYYSFPVGVWKRGFWGKFLRLIPKLRLRPYHVPEDQKNQLHTWSEELSSYFYPLSEYISKTLSQGFALRIFRDLKSPEDSNKYDARYRLHRWPMILLLLFEKSSK